MQKSHFGEMKLIKRRTTEIFWTFQIKLEEKPWLPVSLGKAKHGKTFLTNEIKYIILSFQTCPLILQKHCFMVFFYFSESYIEYYYDMAYTQLWKWQSKKVCRNWTCCTGYLLIRYIKKNYNIQLIKSI